MRRNLSIGAVLSCLVLTAPVAAQSPKLPITFGPDAAAWQTAPYQGKLDFTAIAGNGEKAAAIGPGGLVVTSAAPIARDSEILVRCRITLPKGQGSGFTLVAGQKKPAASDANALSLQLHVHPSPDPETVSWTLGALPGEKQGAAGGYISRTLPVNRLLLPELTRRRLEQDYASQPTLTKRWLTLRYELRRNAARVWLDGRLLREARHAKIDTAGFVRLTFLHGTQVAEVSRHDLPAADARFERVGLGFDVNTAQFNGQALKRESLPAAGKPVVVGGVPFVLPATDRRGRTHIDLKPSWLACGLVEGSWDPVYGDLARWRGAMERDPARIRFRIPNGQYTKLHLLAAFTGEADTTPIVTAQFYRDSAGHPVNFAGKVPAFTASSSANLPLSLANGSQGKLHLVTIPLEPNGPAAFSDQPYLEFELTKEVRVYRAFPDPTYYSMHGAGLPSGVHVFGITLERPQVEVDFRPDQVAHIWTAPAQPSYTIKLQNNGTAQKVSLELRTTSHDGLEKAGIRQAVELAAGAAQTVKLPLALKRYGHHAVELKIRTAGGERTQLRSLALLHPDTRERGNWKEGKGPIFGMWDWGGGHMTISGVDRLRVLAAAGMESSMGSFAHLPPEDQKYLESIGAKSFFLAYQLAMTKDTLGGKVWDPKKPAEMQQALIKWLKQQPYTKRSKINEPELAVFFAEPLLGPVSYMSLPEYYGDPPYQMTAEEKAAFKRYLDQFVIAAAAIKKEWPHAKCLLPWGIPTFPVPFLRYSKEATALMDGPAIDMVMFERMPEMQLHQVTFSSCMWQLRQEWLKTGKPWPSLITIEGPGTSPARPGAVTTQQEADHTVRAVLILASYNTTRFLGWPGASHCAGYWGEQHYGSGLCEPIPLLNPRPVYSSYATLTRQLNRMNFVKIVPTPSHTVFCTQFKHYKTGELLHVMWTLRGKRPAFIDVGKGASLKIFDSMDNATSIGEKNGKAAFMIGTAPVYVRGLTGDAQVSLGTPDHADAAPGANVMPLANLGDGTWKLSGERDQDYEENHLDFIRRFPGKFSLHAEPGPDGKGKALAIRLEKQERERRTMPFYTSLAPAKPIVIPGKASHLGLWVKAASDWGRVVYCLKDAKGERWLSIGKKNEWNVDDVHNWSAFNFDGWRYLTFELPANSPYDLYREAGTSFWGNYPPAAKGKAKGDEPDMAVDLPLTLEKIIVERRTHVIHATEQLPANPADVVLGRLYAEYDNPADQKEEAIRRSRLRMPAPTTAPALPNPIRRLAETGTRPGPNVTKIAPPEREYDGRRCHVYFAPDTTAKTYEVWVSTYADGRGAIVLGKDWTAPAQLLTGLSPNVDFYLFVVARDAKGNPSRPGNAFKVNLKDMFPQR